jgi:hypothetical protein
MNLIETGKKMAANNNNWARRRDKNLEVTTVYTPGGSH